jgi:hypothetical protein
MVVIPIFSVCKVCFSVYKVFLSIPLGTMKWVLFPYFKCTTL